MVWFLLILACIVVWGITDVLYKASFQKEDPLSYHKAFVWVGIVMALAGFIMSNWSDTLLESVKMVKDDVLYLVPLCLFYAVALFFGLLGSKHLDASVVSTLENIDGAMAAIIVYFFYLLTGYIHPEYKIGVVDVIATVSVIVGVIILGKQEQTRMREEMDLSEDKKKHRFGALALFFPLIYNIADVFSVSEISGVVVGEAEAAIPAIDFFIFECAGFVLVAICIWLYMLIVKKHIYNPFQEEEVIRCGAAAGETIGTMAFIFASSLKPVVTGPITSLYFLVTIILARVFLKERLTKKHYLGLAFLTVGIVLYGVMGIFSV